MDLSNPHGTAEYGSYVRTTTRDSSRKKGALGGGGDRREAYSVREERGGKLEFTLLIEFMLKYFEG